MRELAHLLLSLLCWGVSLSTTFPPTNRPDLVNPLLDRFIVEARARGLNGEKLLANLDSINVIKQPYHKGREVDGVQWTRGAKKWLDVKESFFYADDRPAFRLLFHEIGHALGLEDCFKCKYNIMRGQTSTRANYLFKDDDLAAVYLDIYFEAIKDPEKYNKHHKHR
jgi:hypothetical protein